MKRKGITKRAEDNFWAVNCNGLEISVSAHGIQPKNIGDEVEFEIVDVFGLTMNEEYEGVPYAKIMEVFYNQNPISNGFIDIVDKDHPISKYIAIIDEDGNTIKKIKSYNNLTKEAVIFDFKDGDLIMDDNIPTRNVTLEGSRIVFKRIIK